MKRQHAILHTAVATLAALLFAQSAQAQRQGGRPVGAAGPAPVQPAQPSGPAGEGSGELMKITKYVPADEAKDPDLIGILRLKPFKRGMKSVTVRILKSEDAKITIGTTSFTPDRYPEILSKNLECIVSWTVEGDKPNGPKNMTTIGFQPVTVIGIVDKVEGDVITLKRALPKDGNNWRDDELANMPLPPRPTMSGSNNSNRTPPPQRPVQTKKVKMRTLKIKAMEDVSNLTDDTKQSISAGDIPPGTKVEALVILSSSSGYPGILTTLAYTNADAVVNDDPARPPPPRPGGGGGPTGGG